MSTDTDTPRPYLVSLSGPVYERVKLLAAEAKERGDGEAFSTALREFYRRLQIYPQFGDPLIDLQEQAG